MKQEHDLISLMVKDALIGLVLCLTLPSKRSPQTVYSIDETLRESRYTASGTLHMVPNGCFLPSFFIMDFLIPIWLGIEHHFLSHVSISL